MNKEKKYSKQSVLFVLFDFFFRIQTQPRFPAYSRNHVVLFLHACYWDPVAAKSALERYATIRAASPDLFDNRDPLHSSIQQVFDMW